MKLKKKPCKPSGYWTEERIREEAKKYEFVWQVDEFEPSLRTKAGQMGIWAEVSAHMKRLPKCVSKYSDDFVISKAKQCKDRAELKALGKQDGVDWYDMIKRRKLSGHAFSHMQVVYIPPTKPKRFTDAELFELAKPFTCQRDFRVAHPEAHRAAYKRGLMEEVCAHMHPSKPRWFGESVILRYLFEQDIEFMDEYTPPELANLRYRYDFYLPGLRLMIEYHGIQHYVNKGIGKKDSLQEIQARDLAKKEWCAKTRHRYLVINGKINTTREQILAVLKAKLARFGVAEIEPLPLTKKQLKKIQNCHKWDEESVMEIAAQFTQISKFTRAFHGAAVAAQKNGWWDRAIAHMEKPKERWSKKRFYALARNYTDLKTFRQENGSAYTWARKQNIPMPKHLGRGVREDWSDEEIITLAKRCESQVKFSKKYPQAYHAACRRQLIPKLIEICQWQSYRRKDYETKEEVMASALLYQHASDWKRNEPGAYKRASQGGYLSEAQAHMTPKKPKPKPSKYTLEICLKSARQCSTKQEWASKDRKVYEAAKRLGWFEECTAHMDNRVVKPSGYWTLLKCQLEAKKFETRVAWVKGSHSSYMAAAKNGWLPLCTGHMVKPIREKKWSFERIAQSTAPYRHLGRKGYTLWTRENGSAYTLLAKTKRYDEIRALFN